MHLTMTVNATESRSKATKTVSEYTGGGRLQIVRRAQRTTQPRFREKQ
jgi:hypothetical protein